MLDGVRGAAAPGEGGALLSAAENGSPPRVPVIAPLAPGTAIALRASDLPLTQLTFPVIWCALFGSVFSASRSFPPSVPWLFVKLTNCPDWRTLNDGPGAAACAGAVAGSGVPPTGLGVGPIHGAAELATYPPAIAGWAFSEPPLEITKATTATAITPMIA